MPHPDAPLPGVSWRAVLLGLAGSLTIAAGEPYGVLVLRGSPLAADFSTGAALFLFFALRLVTGSRLRPGELATVYIMMAVACAVPSWGFTMNLIPLLGGFLYYATPENEWADLIQPHLPEWLVPRRHEVVWQLFEGGPRGEALPWGTWAGPLLAWSLFIATVCFVTLCLLVALRRQWVEREKLLFPLAVLPIELARADGRRALPDLLRRPALWLGFALPAAINSLNALHRYYVVVPGLALGTGVSLLRGSVSLSCVPCFEVIGLSYLLSLDVSFGIWFFAVLAHLHLGLERLVGWSIGPTQPFSDPAPPSVAHLALGALFYLVAAGCWSGRGHLAQVWRKAWRGAPEVDDTDELFPYRVAVFGALVGSAAAVVWLWWAGLSLAGALVFLLSALAIFVGLARIISQTGLAYGRATVAAPVFAVNALGSSLVGPAGLAALGLSFAWSADVRTFVMASAATGLKMAHELRLEGRRLFGAVALAVAAALAGSAWAVLSLAYTYGGINLVGWQFIGLPSFAGDWVTQHLNNPEPVRAWHLGYTGAGAVLMAGLSYLKGRFAGFPVHPIGLALGLTHPIYYVWFSVFLAWLAKALILKYGGAPLYLRLRPFFLGLTLGAFGSAGVWLVIDACTGMSGNSFTLG